MDELKAIAKLLSILTIEEFLNFVFFNFPKAHNEFSLGMTRSQQTRVLLDYAEKDGRLREIPIIVKTEHPENYENFIRQNQHVAQLILNQRIYGSIKFPSSALYGRDQELEGVVSWLGDKESKFPFLTVHGIAGVGKSVLIAHAIHNFLEQSASAVVWIDIANQYDDVQDTTRSLESVILSFIVKGLTEEQKNIDLTEVLQRERLVLVFDGIDKLPEPYIQELGSIITTAFNYHAKIILTSRAPIMMSGEKEMKLQGLPLPVAVQWLVEACWQNTEQPSNEEKVELELLCSLLDGHPLSIMFLIAQIRDILRYDYDPDQNNLTSTRIQLDTLIERPSVATSNIFANDRDIPGKNVWASLSFAFDQLSKSEQELLMRLSLLTVEFPRILIEKVQATIIDPNIGGFRLLMDHALLMIERGVGKLHASVRAFVRSKIDELNRQELYTLIGKVLVDEENSLWWIQGINNLMLSENWKCINDAFIVRYPEILLIPPNTRDEEYIEEILARYYLAWLFNEQGKNQLANNQCQVAIAKILREEYQGEIENILLIRLHIIHINNLVVSQKYKEATLILQDAQKKTNNYSNASDKLRWEEGQLNLVAGRLFYRLSDYEQSKEALERAKVIYQALGDINKLTTAMFNLGVITYTLGQVNESIQMTYELLEVLNNSTKESVEGQTIQQTKLRAWGLSNLIERLTQAGKFNDAIQASTEALAYCRKHDFLELLASTLINSAKAYIKSHFFRQAEEQLQESQRLCQKMGFAFWGEIYMCFAEIYLLQGRLDKAIEAVDKALAELHETSYRIETLIVKAQVEFQKNQPAIALRTLLEAETYLKENAGSPYLLARVHLELAIIYYQQQEKLRAKSYMAQCRLYFEENNLNYYLESISQMGG